MTNETTSLDNSNNIAPFPSDVLCGRGAAVNKHPGNVVFREIVKCNKALFHACTKEEKYFVAESIMTALQCQKPSVRFLEQKNNGVDLTWCTISSEKAIRKIFQALREKPTCAQQGFTESADASKRKKRKRDQNNSFSEDENLDEEWNRILEHLVPRSTPLESTAPTPRAEKNLAPKSIKLETTSSAPRAEEEGQSKRRRIEKQTRPKSLSGYSSLSPIEEVTSNGVQSSIGSNQIEVEKTPSMTPPENKSEDHTKCLFPESDMINDTGLDDFQDKISQSINVLDDYGLCGDTDIKIVDFQHDFEDEFSSHSMFGSPDGGILLDNDYDSYLCDNNKSFFDEKEAIKI